MILEVIFWAALVLSLVIGFVYFRDLGDITQMVLKVKRDNMLRFIRNEYRIIIPGIVSGLVACYLHLVHGAGEPVSFWIVFLVLVFFYAFTWVWVHIGLRQQQSTATYYSIDEAKKFVAPSDDVLVLENQGEARAHPDYQMWRPHLTGTEEGLAGENIILTYCGVTHLGHGYVPEIEGQTLDLEVLAQHGNNLIVRDNTTGEPIQQMIGSRYRDGRDGPRMREWPTVRMSFSGFQRAYPKGKVFLNRPSKNPFLWLVDFVMDSVFIIGLFRHYRMEGLLMENMEHEDKRLPNKALVWGFNVADDYVCYTRDFIVENDSLINTAVGDRDVVVSYDPLYDSVGVYYNDYGSPVTEIDFFGNSEQGKLPRVETVKAGMFWYVWVEFNQDTDINRLPIESVTATAT